MDETNAVQIALKYLNRQAYSEAKLRGKLEQSGVSEPESAEAIGRLRSWGYLNDREYGKNRIRALQKRLKSREYIRCNLMEDGLPGDLVEELLSEFYPREAEEGIARDFLKKRTRSTPKTGSRIRSDYAALARAGFSEETIRSCFPEF